LRRVDPELISFFNINTQEDLAASQKMLPGDFQALAHTPLTPL